MWKYISHNCPPSHNLCKSHRSENSPRTIAAASVALQLSNQELTVIPSVVSCRHGQTRVTITICMWHSKNEGKRGSVRHVERERECVRQRKRPRQVFSLSIACGNRMRQQWQLTPQKPKVIKSTSARHAATLLQLHKHNKIHSNTRTHTCTHALAHNTRT